MAWHAAINAKEAWETKDLSEFWIKNVGKTIFVLRAIIRGLGHIAVGNNLSKRELDLSGY